VPRRAPRHPRSHIDASLTTGRTRQASWGGPAHARPSVRDGDQLHEQQEPPKRTIHVLSTPRLVAHQCADAADSERRACNRAKDIPDTAENSEQDNVDRCKRREPVEHDRPILERVQRPATPTMAADTAKPYSFAMNT